MSYPRTHIMSSFWWKFIPDLTKGWQYRSKHGYEFLVSRMWQDLCHEFIEKESVFFINHNEIRRRREIYFIRGVREIIYSAITCHDFIWINNHEFF